MSNDRDEWIQAICQHLEESPPETQLLASLIADGHVFATGKASSEIIQHCGTFWPVDAKQLDIPDRPITLKLKDSDRAIPISDLKWCSGNRHYHFRTDE